MSGLKELLHFLAASIVDEPDKIEIEEVVEAEKTVLRLRVAPDDMGKVIGRQGKTANAIRALLSVAAVKRGTWFSMDIVD